MTNASNPTPGSPALPAHRIASMAVAALLAVVAWQLFATARDALPVWFRLIVATGVLTFGPGAGLTCRLLAPRPWLARVVLALSFGVALAPAVAHVFGAIGLIRLVPYLSAALAGIAVETWRRQPRPPSADRSTRVAVVGLVVVALTMGAAAFAHRMTITRTATTVYGAYDSYDLTYYAAIAGELSHTIPPASPFHAGRMLNHAFYPHVLLAMIHRFGDVPILDLYFRYAWPGFLVLVVLVCFVFVQAISSTRAAGFSALFVGAGSNLAYTAGWFFARANWDEVIWSHNFQGAGAEVLLYGNWTPALIALFAALFALDSALRPRSGVGWALLASATFATTVLAKPWIFAGVVGALAMALLVSWGDRVVRGRLMVVLGTSLLLASPLLYRTATLFDDAQVTFAPAFFPIPLVMAERIGLRDWFLDVAGGLSLTGAVQTAIAALAAAPLFLVGSLGFRLVGLPALWRVLRQPARHDPIWRVLAWAVVALSLASTFIRSVPYHETTQIHQCALFLLALFAGRALASISRPRVRAGATLLVTAMAIPATMQYLYGKWSDLAHPLVGASQAERTVATFLRGTDAERTVILHDRPNDPSVIGILAERRSVLAWAGYVRGSDARRADVEAFFAAPDPGRALEILRTTRPTHVIEYVGRDRLNDLVRDRLELVFRTGDAALYRVPERLLTAER